MINDNKELCSHCEGAICNTMISRGDKLVKHVLHDLGITLYFEGTVGFPGKPLKYTIDIRHGHKDTKNK